MFIALDPADGRVTVTLPIGRGVDGMVHDEARHLLITANGVDCTLSVIRQDGPDGKLPAPVFHRGSFIVMSLARP